MAVFLKPRTIIIPLVLFVALAASAQTSGDHTRHRALQYSSGTTWAMQAMAALTGSTQVNSVNESGSIVRTIGGDQESGTVSLQSTGNTASQITISTSAGNRSETRQWDSEGPSGQWTDLDGQPHQMAQSNCWTDAVWFFPALSLLSDYADPTLVFTDLGQEQHDGHSVEHIQAYRSYAGLPQQRAEELERLSSVDYYLDSQTALPLAMAFSTHDNRNMNIDVPVEIVFSQYQAVSGIQVPFQVTRVWNGSPLFQISITSAAPNNPSSPIQKY
jgi:hypothetical protein